MVKSNPLETLSAMVGVESTLLVVIIGVLVAANMFYLVKKFKSSKSEKPAIAEHASENKSASYKSEDRKIFTILAIFLVAPLALFILFFVL